ncbi:MAG: sulfatase-like hydrolase/transferase, partial [Bacteroidota bacterium]
MPDSLSKQNRFWWYLLAINLMLFVPKYLFNLDHAQLLPFGKEGLAGLLSRTNEDSFRLSGELLVLTGMLAVFLQLSRKLTPTIPPWFKWLVSLIFLVFFYYQLMLEFSLKLYGEAPSFLNDLTLIRQVLPIFLSGRGLDNPLYIIAAIIGFVAVSTLFVWLVHSCLSALWDLFGRKATTEDTRPHRLHWYLLLSLQALTLFSLLKYPPTSNQSTIQWSLAKIAQSADKEGFDKLETIENKQLYQDYLTADLRQKPNIYLIVIEAYGSVISLAKNTSENYGKVTDDLTKVLSKEGWYSTSNYSESPIQGGRSWLAFSSLMSGLRIENQLHYNDLLHGHPDFPHLIRYLNGQDYRSYRLTTLSATESAKKQIPQQAMNRLWDYTRWLQFDDVPYRGYAYNNFGGIPDQYALEYFNESVTKQESGPEFLFFITMTSHAPWYSPPPLVDDWRQLDELQTAVPPAAAELLQRYEKTIHYELNFLTKFITETADSNSIFILVGDHQPAGLMYQLPN